MDKRGFTLTEILAVIALIGIIALIAVPSALTISRNTKRRLMEAKKDLIISAAELYSQENLEAAFVVNPGEESEKYLGCASSNDINTCLCKTDIDNACVKISTLLREEYLEPDVKQNEKIKNGVCNNSDGCMVDPSKGNENLNDEWILVKRNDNNMTGKWKGESNEMTDNNTMLNMVCRNLLPQNNEVGKRLSDSSSCDCNNLTNDDACLISGNNVNNWVLYPNDENAQYWRIIGVYCTQASCSYNYENYLSSGLTVKMISEEETQTN